MADYNRTQRGTYRTSNQDWNENRNRYSRFEDDKFGSSEYRGNSNRESEDDNAGWQSRPERERNREEEYRNESYNTGRYGSNDDDYNFNDRGFGNTSGWGGNTNYGGSRGFRDRNLYDRDYEGTGRRSYAGTRFGGSNYGNYGDNRGYFEGRNEGRGYGGHQSRYGRDDQDERNWWDRTTDEVSSWFGDEDAERRRERDKQLKAMYRGKGPKNYVRSDERIKEDINDRLSDDPFIDATEIDVTVSNGEVTLTGTVDHRSTKRRAEDIAESVSGVKHLENRIRVGQTSGLRDSESESQSADTSTESTSAVPGSARSRTRNYVTG